MDNYIAGFDVGTDCVSVIVMAADKTIVYSPEPMFHFGNPITVIKDYYNHMVTLFDSGSTISAAFTGSCGEQFANALGVPFFHDTITIPAGMQMLFPDTGYIFHIGAKDSYFFELDSIHPDNPVRFVSDHGTGTKCGGGSGILLTKQCRRFFENSVKTSVNTDSPESKQQLNDRLNNLFDTAEEIISTSDKSIDVGGRCGVVIQSDMIHLQNSGEQINNILSGLYQRVIKNYKSDVLKTRALNPSLRAVVSGGVFKSRHMVSMLEKTIGISIISPDNFRLAGAAGAVIKSLSALKSFKPEKLDFIAENEKQNVKMAPALNQYLKKVTIYDEDTCVTSDNDLILFESEITNCDVIIGVDGGSTTTKAVVVNASNLNIIARICLYTNGRPLETIQDIFKRISQQIGNSITIKAIAYTGSSGAFYHKLFTRNENGSSARSADILKDEITCHAYGVKHFNENTDTIFELGGQDAKFTLFNRDGTVKKSRMNLSCMAGTGQTMQNMVEMIGLDINTTFHDYALKAERTPIVDDTCGVFTEAGIAKLIALGFPKEEIAAAIAYGFMGGYVNKFIGNEVFGEVASAQGGPFNGKAPLAALAMHTGLKIHAFPHRQLFGALGAAIAARKEIDRFEETNTPYECRFRGLEAADMSFIKSENTCGSEITDSCKLKDCRLSIYTAGHEKILTGGACPKGNTGTRVKRAPDYVSVYKNILEKHLAEQTVPLSEPTSERERILIPRSLTFLNEKGVFYTSFYHALGFDVCVSPESNDEISEYGLSYAHSETCFPVKLAHGHTAVLKQHLRPGKDKLLLINAIGSGKEQYKFCPYVSAAGFLAKDALELSNDDVLIPVIYFDDPTHPLDKSLLSDLKRIFGNRFSLKDVKKAIKKATYNSRIFLEDVYSKGEQLVSKITRNGNPIFIGIGRGYTLFDDKASSKVHELFASNGLHFLPSFFIKPPSYDISHITENMYWVQGRSIIRYTMDSAIKSELYPVRATNFNCGSDSMLLFHEEKIMEKAEKPHLILQTDGHSSNAQFGTRALANHEVVKHHKPKNVSYETFVRKHPPVVLKDKLIGIPFMGDNSYILASTFKALGYDSEVMPSQTQIARDIAAKITGSNICMPFSFQVGDTLAWMKDLQEKGVDPNRKAVVLEPMAKGPCRFGQYHVLLKKIFDDHGYDRVDVLSPDADRDYSNLPLTDTQILKQAIGIFKGSFCLDVLHDALLRTRPYESEKGTANRLYSKLRSDLCNHIEKETRTKELVRFMDDAKHQYESLINKHINRKPVVAITGEIFVRLHPVANTDSIELLEKYGLETRLSPLSQWIEYTNKMSINKFIKENKWKHFFTSVLKKNYMESRGKKLYQPFIEFLKGREPHDSGHIISYIQNDLIYDKHIEGESPLSIGEAYMFAKGKLPDISGIYHVGPFGCMQETTATSQIHSVMRQIRKKAGNTGDKIIPFMDAVFGDSELSNLEAEIAVFSEKCYLRHQLKIKPDSATGTS